MNIEEYLNMLADQIRCKTAKEPVKREVRAHIEDQTEAFIAEGMDEEDARDAAVLEMGDPVAVGGALDRIHRPRLPWKLLLFAAVLGAAGLLIQYFLQGWAQELPWTADISYRTQFFYLAASVLVMVGVCYFDYSRAGYYAKQIYCVFLILLMVNTALFTKIVNGASRWIYVFGVSVNVAMLLLLFIPLYAAILYSYRGQGYRRVMPAAVGWAVFPLFLALRCTSVFTFFLLYLVFLAVFAAAVCRGWFRVSKKVVLAGICTGTVLLVACGVWYILNYGPPYQAERLKFFFNRGHSEAYQAVLLQKVFAGSKWIGAAAQEVRDQLSGTLSLHDYTLAYIFAYCGILAGVLVVLLIVSLLAVFFRMALKQKNQMGMLMGFGCCAVFIFQVALYVADNLGISLLGSYCPFLTYGGSGMLVTYTLCGLMLSIYRYENTFPETEPAPGRIHRGMLFQK